MRGGSVEENKEGGLSLWAARWSLGFLAPGQLPCPGIDLPLSGSVSGTRSPYSPLPATHLAGLPVPTLTFPLSCSCPTPPLKPMQICLTPSQPSWNVPADGNKAGSLAGAAEGAPSPPLPFQPPVCLRQTTEESGSTIFGIEIRKASYL